MKVLHPFSFKGITMNEGKPTFESKINGFQNDYVCEKCGHTQKVNIIPYINFKDNPEYYGLVKGMNIFKVRCEKCGTERIIQFDTLIVDETAKYFIYLLTDKSLQNNFKHQVKYFVETTLNKNDDYDFNVYKTRLVFSPNDLIEKMTIFEAGLNDEAIEIIKYGLYFKEVIDKSVYDCLYFDGMNNADLDFVAFSSKTTTVNPQRYTVGFAFYNKVIDDISHIKNRNHSYFEVIDQEWVVEKFENKSEKV